MSLIRVKQIEPDELFNFVENIFSGEIAGVGTDIDYLMSFTSGVSGYADTLSGNVTNLSGQVVDAQLEVANLHADLDFISGTTTDLGVELNSLSGNLDIVSGLVMSFSGLTDFAYNLSVDTDIALHNTGAIIDELSGNIETLSGNLSAISGNLSGVSGSLNDLSGSVNDLSGNLELNGAQILGVESGSSFPSGVGIGRGLEISGGYLQIRPNCVVSDILILNGQTGVSTTIMPGDITIPQSGEGAEMFNITYTPILETSNIIIDFNTYFSSTVARGGVVALFLDNDVDAISTKSFVVPNAGYTLDSSLKFIYPNTTTAGKNFKIRVGPTAAGNIYWNRSSSSQLFSGTSYMSCRITETTP